MKFGDIVKKKMAKSDDWTRIGIVVKATQTKVLCTNGNSFWRCDRDELEIIGAVNLAEFYDRQTESRASIDRELAFS